MRVYDLLFPVERLLYVADAKLVYLVRFIPIERLFFVCLGDICSEKDQ